MKRQLSFSGPRERCAVSDSLMLQNRSSSTESAHGNIEAIVNGHGLDSSSKSVG